jgi:hypothetical protein
VFLEKHSQGPLGVNKSRIQIGIEAQKGSKTNLACIVKKNSSHLCMTSMAYVKALGSIWKETMECSKSSNVDLLVVRAHVVNHALEFLNVLEVDPVLCAVNLDCV